MPHHEQHPSEHGQNYSRRYTRNYGRNAVGVFRNRSGAECAIDRLLNAGFANDRISMVTRESEATKKWADEYGVKTSKIGEGAAMGAGTGGALGGIAGFLAGLGLLAIPGVGPLLAAGPIAATLGGALAGGAAGGLVGALVGLGIPEEEARFYEEDVKQGNILVVTECDGNCDRAYAVFKDCGATNFDTTTPETGFGTTTKERAWGGTIPDREDYTREAYKRQEFEDSGD